MGSAFDGRIDFVNAQAETTLGYQREELNGRNIDVLVFERYHAAHARLPSRE